MVVGGGLGEGVGLGGDDDDGGGEGGGGGWRGGLGWILFMWRSQNVEQTKEASGVENSFSRLVCNVVGLIFLKQLLLLSTSSLRLKPGKVKSSNR